MSDLDTEDESVANTRMVQGCNSNVLERVSMRDSRFVVLKRKIIRWMTKDPIAIPHKALINFFWNAPTSLRWFQSN